MKILHVINDFTTGGAQKMLCRLIVDDIKINSNYHCVLILTKRKDYLINNLIHNSIPHFYFTDGFDFSCIRSIINIYKFKPDVIQTWLYISDLFGLFLICLFPNANLVWNIRNGKPNFKNISFVSFISSKFCSFFSFVPKAIICPSRVSILHHCEFGYLPSRFHFIPNFIDSNYKILFNEQNIRNRVKSSKVIFGVVSRFDTQKGIDILIKAISLLPLDLNLEFAFIGTGLNKINIKSIMNDCGVADLNYSINYSDKMVNMFSFYDHIHFHISPSRSEAFPNVILESMFFGVPNISSKAGDSELLISRFGRLFDVEDFVSLSNNIVFYYNLYTNNFSEYINLALNCHNSINDKYSSKLIIEKYNIVWNIN